MHVLWLEHVVLCRLIFNLRAGHTHAVQMCLIGTATKQGGYFLWHVLHRVEAKPTSAVLDGMVLLPALNAVRTSSRDLDCVNMPCKMGQGKGKLEK